MHFQTNPTVAANALAAAFPDIPFLGTTNSHKLQYALDETSETFNQTGRPIGKYQCNGTEVIFVNESLLPESDQGHVLSLRKTKLPGIYIIPEGKVATLPKPNFTEERDTHGIDDLH